jgi:hypothetical protein
MFLYQADVHRHTGTSFQCLAPAAHIHVIPADKGAQRGTGKGTFLSDSYSERFRDSGSCTSTQRLPSGSSLYFTGRSINCTRVPTGTVSNRYLMSSFRKRMHPGLPADQYRNWHLSREWHKACRYKLHTGPSDFLARQEQMLASFPRERRIRVGYLASVSSLVLPAYALPRHPVARRFSTRLTNANG